MKSQSREEAENVTEIVNGLRKGGGDGGRELMEAVYGQLRRMAAAKMQGERPGQTIEATVLVHEAWLRLGEASFESRAHFFGAAAEAMRRILVSQQHRIPETQSFLCRIVIVVESVSPATLHPSFTRTVMPPHPLSACFCHVIDSGLKNIARHNERGAAHLLANEVDHLLALNALLTQHLLYGPSDTRHDPHIDEKYWDEVRPRYLAAADAESRRRLLRDWEFLACCVRHDKFNDALRKEAENPVT